MPYSSGFNKYLTQNSAVKICVTSNRFNPNLSILYSSKI